MQRFTLKTEEDWWGVSQQILIDNETGEEVGRDGGAPEDQSFGRNWSWVPRKLNELSEEIKSLSQQLKSFHQ